jgi:hypothetical protein
MAAVLCCVLGSLASASVQAQGTPSQRQSRGWTLTPYIAASVASPVGTRWGLSPDRRHLFLGLHTTIPLIKRGGWSFSYAPELVPVLVITNNPKYHVTPTEDGGVTVTESGRGPVAGFAVGPIGFEGRAPLAPRWSAFGAGALGVVWFTRDVPILNSRLFNFTAEFGGGLLWRTRPKFALRLGYKFHHLSNAKTAHKNPGIDGHVLLVGVERAF